MRRLLPFGTALAIALVLPALPAAQAAPAPTPVKASSERTIITTAATSKSATTKKGRFTEFALAGGGYGTRVEGGDLPASSGRTAHKVIGCTNEVGLKRQNSLAGVTIPGLGEVGAITTTNRTRRTKSGRVASITTQKIAGITLANNAFGKLELGAISTRAEAYHDPNSGFGTNISTSLLSLWFTPQGGKRTGFDVPLPGQPVNIPGLGRVSLGNKESVVNKSRAVARADALEVYIAPTKTRIRVAHSSAKIFSDIRTGLFRGRAGLLEGKALAGLLDVGRTQNIVMPCSGTGGKVKKDSVVDVDLPGVLEVSVGGSRQMGKQNARRAWGHEESSLARVALGGDVLVIDGIKASVKASRLRSQKPSSRTQVDTSGTTVGSITLNGQKLSLPKDIPSIEIPGLPLLSVKFNVIERGKWGAKAIAVQLSVLDASSELYGAKINLGTAMLKIYDAKR
ncbi:choice-of-anchor P family protein [Nocardioides ochotonae]|uniref:choice-of-anchor P family protein n=1 Tax=Nocardioides ochotonae TaxID=2685869 RepID=UPI001409C79E|nr:choice-of-anchor P family protein [Nocardioides ochotonae]